METERYTIVKKSNKLITINQNYSSHRADDVQILYPELVPCFIKSDELNDIAKNGVQGSSKLCSNA